MLQYCGGESGDSEKGRGGRDRGVAKIETTNSIDWRGVTKIETTNSIDWQVRN